MGLGPEAQQDFTSNGPIATQMPVFSLEGNEIMTVQDHGDGMVTIYQENPLEPQQLDPDPMYAVDYRDLLEAQSRAEEEHYVALANQYELS